MKTTKKHSYEFKNPSTGKATEIIIYHSYMKISVTTRDKLTLDFIERLNNVLKKIREDYKKKNFNKLNSYTVQILSI